MPSSMPLRARRLYAGASGLLRATASLAIASLAAATAAQAQMPSRYTMTVLKPPFLGRTGADLYIDAQNRVFGYADSFRNAGFVYDGQGKLVWHTFYNSYIATWPASSAASVSSTRLFNDATLTITGLSPNGGRLLVSQTDGRKVIYDTATRQAVGFPSEGAPQPTNDPGSHARFINDKGWTGGSHERPAQGHTPQFLQTAARWRPETGVELLPKGNDALIAEGLGINAAGEVAGDVTVPGDIEDPTEGGTARLHAAVWDVNGVRRLLDQTPGHNTRALAISNDGKVLVERTRFNGPNYSGVSLELHANGQVQPIGPVPAGKAAVADTHRSLSPEGGWVIGGLIPGTSQPPLTPRAFVYRDGALHDLTELVTARGVKLPTGAYFNQVTSINSKGSMVATYVQTNGTQVHVRLAAVP